MNKFSQNPQEKNPTDPSVDTSSSRFTHVSGRVEDFLKLLNKSPKEESSKEESKPVDLSENKTEEELVTEVNPRTEERLRQAFDTPGFLDFLDKNPNPAFELGNVQEALSLFEAFTSKDKIINTIKMIAQEHFSAVLGIDKVDSLSSVETTINGLCFDNPEIVVMVGQQVDRAIELSKDIPRLENRLQTARASLSQEGVPNSQELRARIALLDKARATIGFLGLREISFSSLFGEGRKARQILLDEGVALNAENLESSIDKLEVKLRETQGKENKLREIEAVRGLSARAFDKLKGHMIQDALNIGDIKDELRAKAVEKLQKMIDGNSSVDDLEVAQTYFETLMSQTNDQKESYFADVADKQKLIDQAIEGSLYKRISEIFIGMNSQSQGSFSQLEKAVEAYLNKNKLGSKGPEEIRSLISESLKRLEKEEPSRLVRLRIKAYLMLNRQKINNKSK